MQKDNRSHLRLPVESTVFIEVISSGADGEDAGKIVRCATRNVSRTGLHVSLEHELTVGTILQIGVELPPSQDTLYLAGEVRWCRVNPAPASGWSAGFALLKAADSDIDTWAGLLIEMEH